MEFLESSGDYLALLELVEYLVGRSEKTGSSLLYDGIKKKSIPVLDTPFKTYLKEVNRFLFSGGVEFDLTDIRGGILRDFFRYNRIDSRLETIWERGSIMGELALVPLPDPKFRGRYNLCVFEYNEFNPIYENGELVKIEIETNRIKDGKAYVYRLDIDSEAYHQYPLVELWKAPSHKWVAKKEKHSYRQCPVVIIKNQETGNLRGLSDFDYAACQMATHSILQLYNASENFHYFGHPLFVSPDPKDTLKRLQQRVQVLQKESNDMGGGIDMLTPQAISPLQLELSQKLRNNCLNHLGINIPVDVGNISDMSAIALKTLNESTISMAETKWSAYVSSGLEPLLGLVLVMSAVDGYLANVFPDEPDTYQVKLQRKKPYFSQTPQDKLLLLQVADSLTQMGVSRISALQETIYPEKSLEDITQMMSGGFDL